LDLKEIDQQTKTRPDLVFNSKAVSSFSFKNPEVPTMYLTKTVNLKNISYRYSGTSELALRDISLSIEKGQSIALIGKSGAGKTTLVDVILGLLKPDSGDISVDGVSIYGKLRSWQNLVGYIPQSISLLDESVERNIAFGVPEHMIDSDRLNKAIKAAQLEELIEQLPDGIKTSVGERGVRLSGGQRQRIGIARALYFGREILVLDEATSALDNETESLVTEAIRALSGTKTMIIIAHRLTTVEHCDRIYLLDKGRIVQSGSYREVVVEHKVREHEN
jgi:ABC-type multidrug transport system fused ATPase/permease subunit